MEGTNAAAPLAKERGDPRGRRRAPEVFGKDRAVPALRKKARQRETSAPKYFCEIVS